MDVGRTLLNREIQHSTSIENERRGLYWRQRSFLVDVGDRSVFEEFNICVIGAIDTRYFATVFNTNKKFSTISIGECNQRLANIYTDRFRVTCDLLIWRTVKRTLELAEMAFTQ